VLPAFSATQSFTVTLLHIPTRRSSDLVSNQTIAVGMTLMITNVANDTDGDKLTFTLGAGAATNATLNATNGVFAWAPVQSQIGTNAFSVIVTANRLPALYAAQSFTVTM